MDILLLHVIAKLEVPSVVAVSEACARLCAELDECEPVWSRLRAGCRTRQQFADLYVRTCSSCAAVDANEFAFEFSPGLCSSCAVRMPGRALQDLVRARQRRDWRLNAKARDATRRELRALLGRAAERARTPGLEDVASRPLRLAFHSERDGASLGLLRETLARHAPCFLLVTEAAAPARTEPAEASEGSQRAQRARRRWTGLRNRFGAYVPLRLAKRTEPDFGGDGGGGAFFFRLRPSAGAAEVEVYPARGGTGVPVSNFYCTGATFVAFGGTPGAYGIAIDGDLQHGRCLPSTEFGAPVLSSAVSFRIARVEVWRAVSEEEEELERMAAEVQVDAPRGVDDDEAAFGRSVLEPGTNKFMLEFVNMREDLLMERRAQ